MKGKIARALALLFFAKAFSQAAQIESAERFKKLGDEFFSDAGFFLVSAEDQKNALVNYKKAFEIYDAQGRSNESAELAAKIGLCLGELNSVFEAEKYLEKARSLLSGGAGGPKNSLLLAEVLQELAFIETDNERAAEFSQKAKSLSKNFLSSQKDGEWPIALSVYCKANSSLAVSYMSMKDDDRALLHFEEGMKILSESGAKKTPVYVKHLANLALLHSNQKQYEKAISLLEEGLKFCEEEWGRFSDPARRCERSLAMVHYAKKDYARAKEHYAAQAEIALKVWGGRHSFTAEALRQQGLCERMLKDHKNSARHLEEALKIQREIYGDQSPALVEFLRSLGNAYRSAGDYKGAQKCWMEALSLFEKSSKYNLILTSCWDHIKNRMGEKKWDWRELLEKSVETAAAAVERARTGAVSAIRDEILEMAAPFYYAGIELALSKKNCDAASAFNFAESVKSRGFLNQVGSEIALSLPEISSQEAGQIRALEAKVAKDREELGKFFSTEEDLRESGALERILKSAEENERALAALEESLAKKNPKYAQLRNPVPCSAEDARNFCAGDEAIVEFALWNQDFARPLNGDAKLKTNFGSYAIVITKQKIFSVRLGEANFSDLIFSMREKIFSLAPEEEFEAERNALYAALFSEIEKRLPKSVARLLIAPDGPLAFLPFDILRPNKKSAELSAKYELSFSPSVSISILKNSQPLSGAPESKMLAMGGGWYNAKQSAAQHRGNYSGNPSDAQKRGIGGGGKKKNLSETSSLSESELRNYVREKGAGAYFKDINLEWLDLPGTLVEIEALEESAASSKKVIRAVKQEEVTEANVKALSKSGELKSYSQLHFACHGYFDSRIPELSGIVFSEVSQGGAAAEDGYLTTPEILRLSMDCDFACLSACETGLGRIKVGDGLTGLSRAFMVSGSKKVGVTLWCVDDDATRAFMTSLYEKVSQGKNYSRAYFETRAEFREGKNKEWRHPYYRSAFVLYE